MFGTKKPSQSEIDGVQYRRIPTWQVAIGQLQCGASMSFYALSGLMSYIASEGYGIAIAVAGMILSVTRILDGLIDPILALIIDRFNSRFGKLRILLFIGWALRSLAVLMMFVWFSDGNHGLVTFVASYILYIVGHSLQDIVGNMIPAIMTNDPRQRPTVQVWTTIYNYLSPMTFSLISTLVILPRFGNQFSVAMMSAVSWLCVICSFVFLMVCFIGLTPIDKPENFQGISARGKEDVVKIRDMVRFLKGNRPFQMYVVSAVSDKLAQQVNSQQLVTTMLFGILLGNIQLGTVVSTMSTVLAIPFVIIGAKYAGSHGNKESMVSWTWLCTIVAVLGMAFCTVVDMRQIPSNMVFMVIFFGLLALLSGAKMGVSTANGAMRADIVDYELDRSGKYMPAVVTATYNFVDQIVSSFGAAIAGVCVSMIGYVNTAPQPTDSPSAAIHAMTMFLYYGMPIIGWVCTLIAMRFYKLSKKEMVDVQKRINEKKASLAGK